MGDEIVIERSRPGCRPFCVLVLSCVSIMYPFFVYLVPSHVLYFTALSRVLTLCGTSSESSTTAHLLFFNSVEGHPFSVASYRLWRVELLMDDSSGGATALHEFLASARGPTLR